MQYLFNILLCCAMVAGVFSFATSQKDGKSVFGSFLDKSGLNKAENDAHTIGKRLAQDDARVEADNDALDDKLQRQRDDAQKARDRMQALKDRNAAQMDRLKGR